MMNNKFSLSEWNKMDNSDKYNSKSLNRVSYLLASLDKDERISFLNNNLPVLEYMDDNIQREYVDDNIYNLRFVKPSLQANIVEEKVTNLPYCSSAVQCEFIKDNPNLYRYCSVKVKTEVLMLKFLDPNKITIETLDNYLSSNYDNFSLDELKNYAQSVEATSRKDKVEILNYINYLVVNIEKKRFLFDE